MRQPSHAEIAQKIDADAEAVAARLARGEERFKAIEDKLTQIVEALRVVPEIKADLAAVKEDTAKTKEIVEAWTTVKTVGRFIKWGGAIATGLTAMFAAIYLTIRVAAAHIMK